MKVYDNDKSSAAYRLRIALHLKGLTSQREHIVIHGPDADNRQTAYISINPQGLVPVLELENGQVITQSLAIIEYLDELYPASRLLPTDAVERAHARMIALAIACDIHPFGTPRVASYLKTGFGADPESLHRWVRNWIEEGFNSLEYLLATKREGVFALGDAPTVADIFLVPQAFGAEKNGFALDRWSRIAEIVRRCRELPAFTDTQPV